MKKFRFSYVCAPFELKEPLLVGSWDWNSQLPMRANESGYEAELALPHEDYEWGVRDGERWAIFHDAPPRVSQTTTYRVTRLAELGAMPTPEGWRFKVWAPHALAATLLLGAQRLPMRRAGEFFECRSGPEPEGTPFGYEFVTLGGRKVLRADPYSRARQGPAPELSDLFLHNDTLAEVHRYQEVPKTRYLQFESPRPTELRFFQGGRQLKSGELRRKLGRRGQRQARQRTYYSDCLERGGVIRFRGRLLVPFKESLLGWEYELGGRRRLLDGLHNWPGLGLLRRPRSASGHRFEEDPIFYELHVGSILGSPENLGRSTFDDLPGLFDHWRRLGVNSLQLMPTNSFEGLRDWGYLGTTSLAVSRNYGGPEAQERFIEQAHAEGFSVYNDVVYNHLGGEHCDLWNWDGPENAWFEHEHKPKVVKRQLPYYPRDTADAPALCRPSTIRHTDWGPIPAYHKEPVGQFFIDHALAQVQEAGFDGLRFDFTHLIHAPHAGNGAGWDMLRRLHRTLRFFYPEVLTFAEEFPQHPVITTHPDQGGAGFDGMWNTEFQHLLVFSHHGASLLQGAVAGRGLNFEPLAQHYRQPPGFGSCAQSVTVISNHDEVGNAERISALIQGEEFGLRLAEVVFTLGALAPGMPILFQGTEFLARNLFRWGLFGTWEMNWDWQEHQQRFFDFCCQTFEFRRRAGLGRELAAEEVFFDNAQGVFGFIRGGFLVVSNWSRRARAWDLPSKKRLVLSNRVPAEGYLPPGAVAVYRLSPTTVSP